MVGIFSELDKKYRIKFIQLYENYLENPESELIKKEANGMGMFGGPEFSEELNKASRGAYKIETGELGIEEAKRILESLKKEDKEDK